MPQVTKTLLFLMLLSVCLKDLITHATVSMLQVSFHSVPSKLIFCFCLLLRANTSSSTGTTMGMRSTVPATDAQTAMISVEESPDTPEVREGEKGRECVVHTNVTLRLLQN